MTSPLTNQIEFQSNHRIGFGFLNPYNVEVVISGQLAAPINWLAGLSTTTVCTKQGVAKTMTIVVAAEASKREYV
jgi:hypothetical protein